MKKIMKRSPSLFQFSAHKATKIDKFNSSDANFSIRTISVKKAPPPPPDKKAPLPDKKAPPYYSRIFFQRGGGALLKPWYRHMRNWGGFPRKTPPIGPRSWLERYTGWPQIDVGYGVWRHSGCFGECFETSRVPSGLLNSVSLVWVAWAQLKYCDHCISKFARVWTRALITST